MLLLLTSGLLSAQTVFEDWVQGTGSQSYFLKSTVKTDNLKNVYQAGATVSSSGDYNVILTKYDARGTELWTETYDVAGYDDAAIDIYIDPNQNIYIAGTTFNPANSGYQVLVLKYNSSGNLIWHDTYAHPGSLYNVATSITGDASRIYIGGITFNTQTTSDFLALAYDTNGIHDWNYTWDNVSLDDGITKIYKSGNSVCLAGGSEINPNKWIYTIISLKATTGSYLYQSLSSGSADGIDRITDISRDATGNIYVTGGAANANSGYDFRTLKLTPTLNIVWTKTYNSSGSADDVANGLVVDDQGNVYVTGYSETAANGTDYTTVKYDASGSEQWIRSYNGKDNAADTAKAIVLDANQNPVITGVSTRIGSLDFYTLKYDAQGNTLWEIDYNGLDNGNDTPFNMALDADGAIIVAGQSEVGGSYRYVSAKYSDYRVTGVPDEETIPSSGYFTRNRGQLKRTDGTIAGDVKYIANGDYPKVYVQDDKLSYVFARVDSAANDTVHRIDMVFNKRKKIPKMRAMDKMDFYQNYYIADLERERVASYKKLIHFDAWEKVDLMLSHNNKGLKYYLICKPGFDPADIKWEYQGASAVATDGSGALVLSSGIGTVTMPKGEAYEVTSSGARIDKSWQPGYNVSGSEVSPVLGAYNGSNTLVIEIDKGWESVNSGVNSIGNMLWNSHWGSGSESHFNDVVSDLYNDFYICGETEGGDFPTITGQTILGNYGNGTDVIVLKLSSEIIPEWLTYFGGSEDASAYSGDDIAKAITIRNTVGDAILKDVYICGFTNAVDMPIETNGGQFSVDATNTCTTGECLDGFIAQFDQFGNLNWSTYFGNNGDETLRDIEIDGDGNIYSVGSRNSGTSLTVKNGADNYSTGSGLILEYDHNAARDLIWANAWDGEIILGLAIDQNDNIYTTGGTRSSSMPVMHTDPSFPSTASISTTDNLDAFINKFSSLGQLEFSSYFGGFCYEAGNSIVVDDNSNIYMAGNNRAEYGPISSCSDIPLLNEITSSTGNMDDFVAKINLGNTNAQILFSSYIGGDYIDGIFNPGYSKPYEKLRIKLAISNTGYLFLTTYSRSQYSGDIGGEPLPDSQPEGYYVKDDLTSEVGDNYIAAFDPGMNLIWATYHGSDKYDYCGGLALSHDNNRLMMVGTGNQGATQMNVFSFDPEDFSSSDDDYYQLWPVAMTKPCAQGVLFDISDIDQPVSVTENSSAKNGIRLWPNPSHGKLSIQSNLNIKSIELFSISGEKLNEIKLNRYEYTMDISDLSSGVYFFRVKTAKESTVLKFIRL